ncbi:hypothetical protein A1O7_02146 [Cladophialophora yegresii CBS 114405]|uniref:Uncharacterized protein n=1 Tax=Cladophialophora yegresii CBS 114405 TaxID=1182544 RepID=W9W0W2_9EURO|nr:uncharacterized protein A1O7_02146 [Cladophialophora yegresii CBS 114405]EXJ61717.1 hypothetical protein A1O7_02146 [Cladophialophora yegresii CBS 114405]
MARTIRDLERLVAEAVELAETAGAPVDQSLPDETRQNLARRPTLGLAKKISQYLEEVSSKATEPDPTSNSESPSSKPSSPKSPYPQDQKEKEVETVRCQGPCSADDLLVLPPEPVAEPMYDKRPKLVRSRTSIEASPSSPGAKSLFLSPPQIGPRTTSARPDDESRPHMPLPTPAIQLNSDKLKVHFEEDKEPLLSTPRSGHERHFSDMFGVPSRHVSINMAHPAASPDYKIDLKGARHVDIAKSPDDLNVHSTCHHAPVARNWPGSRKRFAAWMSCINTACIGILLGIYAGEVPAIQYVIVDVNRQVILGNVCLYIGLAISTLIFWPLPLLHGRKLYTLVSLASALCLQIPQGIMVLSFRDPHVGRYRIVLLLSRGISGFALGFANINNFATLLDVFGASLQSDESQEQGNPYDVRRHGGGMGLWLGFWSSCSLGTISIGFLLGATIINGTSVDWGFWVSSLLLMLVTLLNVMAPEVRRSAFRRTIAEITGEGGSFSRVARGEIKFHLTGNGPYWWGEEVLAGIRLSWRMVKQPGFLVLSIYGAWVYAQFILVIMLLGALASTQYRLHANEVGVCVFSLALGSVSAIPFQTGSWFSRSRYHPSRTDSMTFQKAMVWSSHTVRRLLYTLFLPLTAIGYALSSRDPPFPIAVPCIFAGLVGFGANLAIAECFALLMGTFDTSDLQPGMTGRPARKSITGRIREQRTNFSCYPRVSAGVAVTQFLMFVFGAVATGIGGRVERRYGAEQSAGIVAGVLMALTLALTVVLYKWKSVQMIPVGRDRTREESAEGWEPVILGLPSGFTRKINTLEAGTYSRWSEIRRRNHLTTELREVEGL